MGRLRQYSGLPQARRPGGADMFVGFGGIARRPVVEKSADWFVTSFQPLLDSL